MNDAKVIEVDGNGKSMYGASSRISFSLISSYQEGHKQLLGLETCRDYINDCLISFFNVKAGNLGTHYWTKLDPQVDTSQLYILMSKSLLPSETKDSLHEKMCSAKRIINMYEDLAGFKKRSVLKWAKHSNKNIKLCWVLTSPPEWLKSSHLVSMITLIFRVVIESKGFEGLKNINEVEERFNELCNENYKKYNDCGAYLPITWPKFRMLMEYYDEMFRSKTNDFWYPSSMVSGWHGNGGIVSLCRFSTNVDRIDNLTKSMWEMWNNNQS
jgi:hypothetical protein